MYQDKESFEHLCTVLMIMWGDMREIECESPNNTEEWNYQRKRIRKKHNEAKAYLKGWIKSNYTKQ